ncbi:effector-associated constant component EACC1 [Amycolatopsis nivea]
MTAGIAAITVDGSADEVQHLVSWLGAEDELAGRVRLAGPGSGVVVMVSSRSAGTFCRSLFGWLHRQRDGRRVSLTVKRSGAVEELDVDCGGGHDVDEVLASVRSFLDQD